MQVHPLIFSPIYQPRLWGGRRLHERLGKNPGVDQPIGESWELCDLPQAQSVVAVGPARGKTLGDLVREWGPALTGRAELLNGSFPLLIKFLDARENLSVQVHPDRAMAEKLGVRIKHEAWYVLTCEKDAVIYKGLKPGVTRENFAAAVAGGTCADLLGRLPVKPGDAHYLPSGTVHALGAGVMVAEVQTPSDVTYRLFDWNRVDAATSQPRELHIEQAIECIHFGPTDESAQKRSHVANHWTTVTRLIACPSFVMEKVRMVAGLEQNIPYAEPVVWIVLSGQGQIIYSGGVLPFKPGDTILLPAGLKQGRVRLADDTVWLEVTIPTPSDLAEFDRPPAESFKQERVNPYVQLNYRPGGPDA